MKTETYAQVDLSNGNFAIGLCQKFSGVHWVHYSPWCDIFQMPFGDTRKQLNHLNVKIMR